LTWSLRLTPLTPAELIYTILPAAQSLCERRHTSRKSAIVVFRNVVPTQLNSTRITLSPLKNILLINLSLLIGLPFFPSLSRGVSVHISFTFSSTMLQCRSKAFTLASSFRLLRHEIRTCVWFRTAVWRSERGPAVNSWVSRTLISYSVSSERGLDWSSLEEVC